MTLHSLVHIWPGGSSIELLDTTGFSYVAGANGDVFVWLMLLYGYFWWVVAVVPSHVQLPIADLQQPPQQ